MAAMKNNRNNMPPGFVPPHPAWQATWIDSSDPLVAGYFGIQADAPDLLDRWARTALTGNDAPFATEQGAYRDQRGIENHLYIGYWRYSSYHDWWAKEANRGWWRDEERQAEGVGYWREIITMPFDRFETLHSTDSPHGISVSAEGMEGPVEEHAYPGAMRDRIPRSAVDSLRNPDLRDTPIRSDVQCGGKRVLVTPPQDMCVIRSGQNWSLCDEREKDWYLEKLHPVLLEGMRFLRDNPVETNCYSLRFVNKTDGSWGSIDESFGLGYSTDVYAFENWAKSHPTHVAIFDRFLEMVDEFGEGMKLRLWHEVTALPGENCAFEYIACHPETGLLRYV